MKNFATTQPTMSARRWTAPVVTAAYNLLPISDVVVFDGRAGIRTWSPPV